MFNRNTASPCKLQRGAGAVAVSGLIRPATSRHPPPTNPPAVAAPRRDQRNGSALVTRPCCPPSFLECVSPPTTPPNLAVTSSLLVLTLNNKHKTFDRLRFPDSHPHLTTLALG
ncbi:hypothetical protein J6590_019967 [Homalodisca vitripennis]|nr:hypothetical protein J6590_019967 [Homalodisca vitripennis]